MSTKWSEPQEHVTLELRRRPPRRAAAQTVAVPAEKYTFRLVLFWLVLELVALWALSGFLRLPEWCITYLPFLTRSTAGLFNAAANILLSLLMFRAMRPAWDNAMCSVVIPPGILLCVPFLRLHRVFGALLLLTLFFYTVFRISPYFVRMRTARTRGKRKNIRRLIAERCVLSLWIMAVVITISTAIEGAPPLVLAARYTGSGSAAEGAPLPAEEAWDGYQPTLRALMPGSWAGLDLQGRLDVLQQVVDYEAEQTLGCSSVPVQAVVTENAHTLAFYSQDSGTISIDRDHIMADSEATVVDTVLHELRHHYQKQVTDCFRVIQAEHPDFFSIAYFDEASTLLANEDNYISSDADAEGYYEQPLEADARTFADKRMNQLYLDIIDS